MTHLHLAVEGNHRKTVKYLIDKGADINIKDDSGVSVSVWDYTSENKLFETRACHWCYLL